VDFMPWPAGNLATLRDFVAGCDVVTPGPGDPPLAELTAVASEGAVVLPSPPTLRLLGESAAVRSRLAELSIPFEPADPGDTRLVVVVARSPFGQVAVYPLAEAVWREGGLRAVVTPVRHLTDERVAATQRQMIELVTHLDLVGTFTITLRQPDPTETRATSGFVVTELAVGPRPAGNWTLDGALTSQYEQWLRALLDYPLGDTSLAAPWVVTVTVPGVRRGDMALDERLHHCFASDPGAKIHLYGVRPDQDRAIGHVTVLGADLTEVRARAARALRWLREGKDD
jgi:5-(carboxyamino)imidazole ribonucleotide synthase